MKTSGADTVLYRLRVSSFSPSPDPSSGPVKSRRYQHKTTVFNGVSANSWLLPIGICERDTTTPADSQPESSNARPKSRNNKLKATKETLEPKLICNEPADVEVGDDASDSAKTDGLPGSEKSDREGENADPVTDSTKSVSGSRALTSEEFDLLWGRVSHRPQHTGNVFIVHKRNVPEGIGKNEYLQGKHLRSKFEADGDDEGEETKTKLQPRPFTAPGKRKGMLNEKTSCTRPPRPFSHTGVRRLRDGHERISSQSGPLNSSLDLVVTSFQLPADISTSAQNEDSPVANTNATSRLRYCLRPKTASGSTSKTRQQGDSLSTIDGIKRDYMRRAKSAPPKVRSADISATLHYEGTSSCRGPSLYWRARSAYHKKLMTYGTDEGPDPNEQSQNIRGSLWRPLIVGEDGGLMQHSAGCPYKCKGCFKACLVSQDYLEKARAQKALREKEQARQTGGHVPHGRPISVPHKYRVKVNNPHNLVSIALARSQPLYQLVHGKKSREEDSHEHAASEDKENEMKPDNDVKDQCANVTFENHLTHDSGADTKTNCEDTNLLV